jgi:hypothetical protein
MIESKLIQTRTQEGEKYVKGYFLTVDQLQQLILDYHKDDYEDRIPNDQLYIMRWLNKNNNIL